MAAQLSVLLSDSATKPKGRRPMAIIENSGTLPYLMTDFDQHSYEAAGRVHPVHAQGQAAHGGPTDQSVRLRPQGAAGATTGSSPRSRTTSTRPTCPGSLVEMLKQRASGDATDAERFYEPIQPEYRDRDKRLVQLDRAADREVDHVPRRLGACSPRPTSTASTRSTTTSSRSTAGSTRTGASPTRTASTRRRCCRCATSTEPAPELDRVLDAGARFILLPAGPGVRPLARRPVLRPVLGPHQRGQGRGLLPHLRSSTTRPTSPRTGAGAWCRRSSSRPGSGRTPTASGRSPTRCPR